VFHFGHPSGRCFTPASALLYHQQSFIGPREIAERALNKPRNLTSTTPQLQQHLKINIQNQNKK
jgi:hypothetical protein